MSEQEQENNKYHLAMSGLELELLLHIMTKRKYLTLALGEQATYLADLVGYHSQLALYELFKEGSKRTVAWDDYVLEVRRSVKLRKAICAVAFHAAAHFDARQLDFEIPEEALAYIDEEIDERELVGISKIFSDDDGWILINFLLLQAEQAHYGYLARLKPADYRWDDYRKELQSDGVLWSKLSRAFQSGLRKLDYRASWRADEIKEARFLREEA